MTKLPKTSPIPQNLRFLTSNLLRILAVVLMTIDHLWASVVPGNQWMAYVGRLAFPIFAFMIAEGFVHTSNRKRYITRMLIFAVATEIPFNLFYIGSPIYPFHQNVLVTFVWALLGMSVIERFKRSMTLKNGLVSAGLFLLVGIGTFVSFPDYGFWGMMTAVMFYVARDFPFAFLFQIAAMYYINFVGIRGEMIPMSLFGFEFEFAKQGIAIFSLIPIWLYSGKRGMKSKVMQYGFYVYYPLHMLILWAIWKLL